MLFVLYLLMTYLSVWAALHRASDHPSGNGPLGAHGGIPGTQAESYRALGVPSVLVALWPPGAHDSRSGLLHLHKSEERSGKSWKEEERKQVNFKSH